MSRIENTSRNILWGVLNNVISIVMPFFVKTSIIYVIGVEYVGIDGLFTSVLQVLSFAELGIGTALIYSMYKPIAQGDDARVCALMNFYKKSYAVIGGIVLVIGLGILPFLGIIINKDLPQGINIYYLYLIYLLNNVVSYLAYPECTSLMIACQRIDLKSKMALVIKVILSISQITAIILFENYYIYCMLIPVFTFLQNYLSMVIVRREFPIYRCRGELPSTEVIAIKNNVKGLVYQRLGGVISASADTMVISSFLGIKVLGIYQTHLYVITALFNFLYVITNAIIPSSGNKVANETKEKNYDDFKKFHFIYTWIVAWCSVLILVLFEKIMILWMGENFILSHDMFILFAVYFFIYRWLDMIYVYKEASGIWWQGRWIPLLAAILNLTLNIILVGKIGLYGILLSTIISVVVIHDTLGVNVVRRHYFGHCMNMPKFYLKQLYIITTTFIAGVIAYYVCSAVKINIFFDVLVCFLICLILPNLILYCFWRKLPEYVEAKSFAVDFYVKLKERILG